MLRLGDFATGDQVRRNCVMFYLGFENVIYRSTATYSIILTYYSLKDTEPGRDAFLLFCNPKTLYMLCPEPSVQKRQLLIFYTH